MNIITFFTVILIAMASFLIHIVLTREKQEEKISKRILFLTLSIFLAGAFKLSIRPETISLITILLGIFIGYLAFNVFTDEKSMSIYSFPHMIQAVIGIYIVFTFYNFSISYFLFHFAIYFLLQKFIFSRMYASGDAKLFLTASLFLASNIGGSFSDEIPIILFMLHMAVSLFVFIIYNACQKNITKKGKLKKEMPFAYSIALGFILLS